MASLRRVPIGSSNVARPIALIILLNIDAIWYISRIFSQTAGVQKQRADSMDELGQSPQECQSAFKFDPSSASDFDPFARRALLVALVSSELAGIAEARRARVA